MRFTTRDLLWLMALVAMGLSWWLDARHRQWTLQSAQLRKDYYNLMSDLARTEKDRYQQLSAELLNQRDVNEQPLGSTSP
jgi:hypothetical protein